MTYAAKKHGIQSPTTQKTKDLPDAEIYSKYMDGTSLDRLSKEYGTSVATIKRHLKSSHPEIKFRTMDEAKRPALLNDKEALSAASKAKSYRTIAKELGVKVKTVTDAAKRFGLEFRFTNEWDQIEVGELFYLYLVKVMTPSQIAEYIGYPYNVVLRQLRGAGFEINKPGGKPRPSKHWQLNDVGWLKNKYLNEKKSINELAMDIGTTPRNVLHHLRKHEIRTRTRQEYLPMLASKMHGQRRTHKGIHCDSQLEVEFLRTTTSDDIVRNIYLEHSGSSCIIDFKIDGSLVEVKPNTVDIPGVDRRRAIKQYMVCAKHGQDVKIWSPKGYVDIDITSDDIYYATNWKLFFDSSKECCEWLIQNGFEPPKYPKLDLVSAMAKMTYCKPENELNANYNNGNPRKLIAHFFPHYWFSTHKDYLSVDRAWQPGNHSVLNNAVNELWASGKEVNIYGLLKHIIRYYKDFAVVSFFKPWVAKYVYDRYLPQGGSVYDPCMGWGGRFMAAVDGDIKYMGNDLNHNSVLSHVELAKFIGGAAREEPEFTNLDASICDMPAADLLFTSPPYDDTELYHGIDSTKTVTASILHNIFTKFGGLIVLNLPIRMEESCKKIASEHGRNLIDRLEMKTNTFMLRSKTYEPILVFK